MFFLNVLRILLLVCYQTIITASSEKCQYIIQTDYSNCTFKSRRNRPPPSESGIFNNVCQNERLCARTYNISAARFFPFSLAMDIQIKRMLPNCCGNCSGMSLVKNLRDTLEVTAESINTSDIIYPVFARSSDMDLYGFWFIPIIDAPSTYYVTKAQTGGEILDKILSGFYELWPFICICLLLAVLAGFVVWLLETWKNKEEFPRSFTIGAFEGFWWSFVSMTTVGYGDKTPKSPAARIFSIVWILCGVSICSMLTASLTNIITVAKTAPSTDMTSQKVGALKGRVYDATVIAKHGGIIVEIEYDSVTMGMDKLLEKLLAGDIDGFLVDRYTYFFCSKGGRMDSKLSKTVRSEKYIKNEKLYYGMLMKNYDDYIFFQGYIMNNWFQLSTCFDFMSNNFILKHSDRDKKLTLFSTEDGLFYPFLKNMAIVSLVICCLGWIYEIVRIKYTARTVTGDLLV